MALSRQGGARGQGTGQGRARGQGADGAEAGCRERAREQGPGQGETREQAAGRGRRRPGLWDGSGSKGPLTCSLGLRPNNSWLSLVHTCVSVCVGFHFQAALVLQSKNS